MPNQAPTPTHHVVTHLNPALYAQSDPVNVVFMQQAKARNPKACGPAEVAPGVWVRIDCHMYSPITHTRRHWTVRKANVLKGGLVGKFAFLRAMQGGSAGTSGGEKAGQPAGGGGAPIRADSGDYPELVDHRTTGTEGPIKNQGYVGTCTAFSLSSAMDNAIRRAGKQEVMSPTHIWSHYGSPHMSVAGEANLNKMITSFENWPYSGKEACQMSTEVDDDCGDAYGVRSNTAKTDPKIQANLQKAEANGLHKVIAFEALDVGPPNIDEIKSVLSSGSDLWIAMKIGSTWMGRSIKDGVIPDWSSMEGGHALLMSGYRKLPSGKHQFLVHNSWGESWGDHGYAWVSEAMVNRWLTYAYKVKLDDGGSNVVELTDDDCAADELVDSITGQCAKMCDDESRPAGGKCGGGDSSGTGLKPHKR